MGKNFRGTKHKRTFKKRPEKIFTNYESGNTSKNFPSNDASFSQQNRTNTKTKISLKEEEVGITEYLTRSEGFVGVVKSRYSDFHVNEIDSNGKILHLNDLSVPQVDNGDIGFTEEELLQAKDELKEIIPPEVWNKIECLAKINTNDIGAEETIEIEVDLMDKEQRTKIHKVIKRLYEGKLVSTTANCSQGNDEERKIIKIYKPKKERGERRIRWNFPGEYVHFLVHKENMETSEVASIMAERMCLSSSQVNYCGTKDKRAKTTQKFCVKRRTPAQIVGSVKKLRNVKVGNFEFSKDVLKLGQLKGNRFRIALRHIQGDDDKIEAALEEIEKVGFINYYGLQRFGNNASVPTHEIGKALLKSDYKLACELILKPRENDMAFMRAIREMWWQNRNSSEAAAMIRGNKYIEKKVLDGLAQYGESNYASALSKIPRNMLLLYPHAYQSFIFNRIASRRIKEFGLQLIPGDLVFRMKDEPINEAYEELLDINEENAQAGEVCEARSTEKDSQKLLTFKDKVKALTADDISSGEWTIFDVVLPLPGYDIALPENEVAKWYEEILEESGLSIMKLKHNVKTYSMTGAYRKLLVKPENMQWKIETYDSPEATLIASDWELLQKREIDEKNEVKGKFKAVVIDLCLPASAYATMFLRELLKNDTSAESQTQLEKSALQTHNTKNDLNECLIEKEAEDSILSVKRKKSGEFVIGDINSPNKKAKIHEE